MMNFKVDRVYEGDRGLLQFKTLINYILITQQQNNSTHGIQKTWKIRFTT